MRKKRKLFRQKNQIMTSLDLSNFVDFGIILDRGSRELLSNYLCRSLRRESIDKEMYSGLYYYTRQIDSILSDPSIYEVVQSSPEVSKQLAKEILDLFQETKRRYLLNNPHKREEEELDRWSGMDSHVVLDNMEKLFSNIRDIYTEEDFSLGFYERNFKKGEKALQRDLYKRSAFVEKILLEWKGKLTEKEMAYEIMLIDDARKEYCKFLYEKIDKFRKLKNALSPFTDELGRLWDLSSGVWHKTGLDILEKYADFLQKEDSIQELARMLGRLDSAEMELQEEERLQKVHVQEWRVEHAAKAELVGVHESDDLNNLVPSELAFLAESSTEAQFFKRYAEKKLMSWEYQARILAEKDAEEKQKQGIPKKKEKGPVIICVDTSGSMHGEPETIAKTVAFAILRIALRDKRPCFLISFSTGIQTLRMNDLQESLSNLIDFLGMSFYGGTDAEPALKEALRQVRSKEYGDSDILVISDFIMDRLSKELSNEIAEARKNRNRLHSLVLSSSGNQNTLEQFDHNWSYNFNGPRRIRELVLDIREVTN